MVSHTSGEIALKDSIYQLVVQSIPIMSLALFGGFVRLFTTKKGKTPVSIRLFIGGILATLFVGLLLNILLLEAGPGDTTRISTALLGGYCARDVLDALSKRFLSNFKDGGDDDTPTMA